MSGARLGIARLGIARLGIARLEIAGTAAAAMLAAAGVATLVPTVATAQVSLNPGALDALSRPPPTTTPAPARHGRPAPRAAAPAPTSAPNPAPNAAPTAAPNAARPARPPTVPTTPPAILALPPAVAVPLAHPPPPPPVPVAADAPGEASPVNGGVRVTFGPDRADLNPATEAALRDFARAAEATEQPINLYAYAAGNPEDPSTPRRLSLARALAARAVLISEGIPSTRIYPRALGPAGGETDPNRVDVLTGVPAPVPAVAAGPGPAPAASPTAPLVSSPSISASPAPPQAPQ